MTDLISSDWKELDADNTQPSPNGVQGGYSPSQVAPIIRSIRGSLKRFYNQTNAVYTTTGSATAYILTFQAAPSGYSKGIVYRFWAHATNTGAATLNINSLGAKAIVSGTNGSALTAGQIVSGRMIEVIYNGTAFELTNLGFTSVQRDSVQFKDVIFIDNATYRQIIFRNSNNVFQHAVISNGDDGSFIFRINDDAGNAVRDFKIPRTGSVTVGGATVWTSENDGVGSGLDADMLDGYQAAALPVSTPVQTALNLKANLASPALTGTPTAPTQTQGNNSTRIATTAYVDAGLQSTVTVAAPTGSIIAFAANTIPNGYLLCNGAAVSRTTYAALFALVGTTYGAGNGSTTFQIPDLRGLFIRGFDNGRGLDPGHVFGQYQDSDNKWHTHGIYDPGHYHGGVQNGTASTGRSTSVDQPPAVFSYGNTGWAATNISINGSGGDESRPRNMALHYIIKT